MLGIVLTGITVLDVTIVLVQGTRADLNEDNCPEVCGWKLSRNPDWSDLAEKSPNSAQKKHGPYSLRG